MPTADKDATWLIQEKDVKSLFSCLGEQGDKIGENRRDFVYDISPSAPNDYLEVIKKPAVH